MWRERISGTLRDLRALLSGDGDRRPGAGGSRANRLRWWICFSGALHLALIVTLLVAPTSTARRDLPVPVYTVDLVAGSMPAPPPAPRRPEPPKAEPPRVETPALVEDAGLEEALLETVVPEPPKAAKASEKQAPPPEKKQAKKPPKPKVKEAPPVKKAVKAPEKPKKKVVKPKKTAKPKKKTVKAKKTVKRKKATKPKKAVKRTKRAPKGPAKLAGKASKAPKPKRKAGKERQLVERLRQRRIDDAVATARERARLRREARVGQGTGADGKGSGGGVVRGMEFVAYRNEMLNLIKDRWTWIGRRRDLEVTVGFGVGADGGVFGLKLLKPSGDASYDESVVRAVRRASASLRPPPPRYARDFAEVEVTFRPGDLDG